MTLWVVFVSVAVIAFVITLIGLIINHEKIMITGFIVEALATFGILGTWSLALSQCV